MADNLADWVDQCPWIEPPPWWEEAKATFAGWKPWPEFLQQQWDIEKSKPPTEKQRRQRELWARAGRSIAVDRTADAIEVLVGKEEAARFREESVPYIQGKVAGDKR